MNKFFRALSAILLFTFSLFIQLFYFNNMNLFGIKPNLILISVVIIGLYNGIYAGTFYSFFAGLIVDLLFGSSTGMFTISYAAIGMILGYVSNQYTKDNYISIMTLTSFSVTFFEIIQYIQSMMINTTYISFIFFIKQLILSIILNIVLVFIIYFVFKKLIGFIDKKKSKIYW